MIRAAFLYLSRQKMLRHWMETSPKAELLTRRFVAGRTLDHVLQVCARLKSTKYLTTLDHLGENVATKEDAEGALAHYMTALDRLQAVDRSATISLKLSQLGMDLGDDFCRDLLCRLAARAAEVNSRIEIDMESSAYTTRTLTLVEAAHAQSRNVRAVIQAYLHRSRKDIERLNAQGIPVRLCKGAYLESPEVAFQEKKAVDDNYIALTQLLLNEGTQPALATHDERMVNAALAHIKLNNVAADRFEFQMLYGIRRDLQQRLVDAGFRLRLYVPYGDAWYPYFMRRLAERPANVWFLARNMLKS